MKQRNIFVEQVTEGMKVYFNGFIPARNGFFSVTKIDKIHSHFYGTRPAQTVYVFTLEGGFRTSEVEGGVVLIQEQATVVA